jgi:hypothetical protein
MALVRCAECGNEVSTQATTCPKCGAPRTAASPRVVDHSPILTQTVGGPGLLLLIIAVAGLLFYLATSDDSSSATHAVAPATRATAAHLSPAQSRLKCHLDQQSQSIALRTLLARHVQPDGMSGEELASLTLPLLKAQNPRIPLSSRALEYLQRSPLASMIRATDAERRDGIRTAEGNHSFDECLKRSAGASTESDTTLVDWKRIDFRAVPPEMLQPMRPLELDPESAGIRGDTGAVAATADYETIPPAWTLHIDLPGRLQVGAQYCTAAGSCRTVGDDAAGFTTSSGMPITAAQACQMSPKIPKCAELAIPVQVLAASPQGSVIVRLDGRNYAASGPIAVDSGGQVRSADEYVLRAPLTPRQSATPPQRSAAEKAYVACVDDQAQHGGPYSSFDGGKSALRMMAACKESWDAYLDDCISSGLPEQNCTLSSGLIPQLALKLYGR